MTVDDIAAWHDFAAVLAGASAGLAGLVFLAVSINVRRIVVIPGLPGRAGESVILFLSVLVECAVLLIPRQSAGTLGIELLVAGGLTWIVLNAIVIPAIGKPTRQPVTWLATRLFQIQIAPIAVMLSGGSLLGWPAGGLSWFAAGVLFAVLAAASNAWVLLVEVVRDERYRPLDNQPAAPSAELPDETQ